MDMCAERGSPRERPENSIVRWEKCEIAELEFGTSATKVRRPIILTKKGNYCTTHPYAGVGVSKLAVELW